MKKGIMYAVITYLCWGLLPLYWRLFESMSAPEILSHRILWSFIFVALLVTVVKRWKHMRAAIADWKSKLAVVLCALFISANWLIFIWAVNQHQVLETSLGYYMNPLISVLFAVIFLKERLNVGQWLAIGLAAIGVLWMAIQYGHVPWIALSLAISFACYGLAKKAAKLDVLLGLTWETMIVFPIALFYLIFVHSNHTATIGQLSTASLILLLLAGVATALPLFWFAKAAERLPLSIVGFIQYIAPTTSLLLAIFVFKEPFTNSQLYSFIFIWCSLVLFSIATFRQSRPASLTKLKSEKVPT
ncbi:MULTISPECIES: EamA family transporter RarD [unclassified Paenibacillus]|uniref:EamA family transporter RarD n=1 Tax=unclassified Paenibacillus TaxID=185978 RepID=UPI002F403420